MKNYSLKTKENSLLNSKKRRSTQLFLLIFVVLFILYSGRNIASTISETITIPMYAVRHFFETSSATIPVFVRSRLELLDHMHTLEQQIASQQGVADTLAYVMEENTELRSLLGATSSPRIAAGVIARPPHTPYDTLILDKGSDAGIVEHAPVYHGGGKAIGYVRSVLPHNALVTLFSSSGVTTSVYVFGSNIFTTAYGEGGGVIRISVPQGITVTRGDMVSMPGIDAGVLGLIDDIQSIASEPEQHAYVTSGVPIQSIRLVSVGNTPITPIAFDTALQIVREEEQKLLNFEIPESARVQTGTTTGTIHASTTSTSSVGHASSTE